MDIKAFVTAALMLTLCGCDQINQQLDHSTHTAHFQELLFANNQKPPVWNSHADWLQLPTNYLVEHLIVEGSINGVPGFKFMLASGQNSITLVDTEKVNALNLTPTLSFDMPLPMGMINEEGRVRTLNVIEDVDIQLGPVTLPKHNVLSVNSKNYWAIVDEREKRYDVIIGLQALRPLGLALWVNPENQTLMLAKDMDVLTAQLNEPIDQFTEKKFALSPFAMMIDVELQEMGEEPVTVPILWATGANQPLTLFEDGDFELSNPETVINQVSRNGHHNNRFVQLQAASLAGKTFAQPYTGYVDVAPDTPSAGLIGAAVINEFETLYDFADDTIYLKTLSDTQPIYGYNRLGLVANRMRSDGYVIQSLVANTPAGNSPLKMGDVITKINGAPALDISWLEFEQLCFESESIALEINGTQQLVLKHQ